MRNTRVLAVVVAVCLLGAVPLYTYDVHVPITGNGPPKDSFCGSAYDVVFLKKDGYMGGEVPANQDRIDAACIARARKFVAAAAASATLPTRRTTEIALSSAKATRRRAHSGQRNALTSRTSA